MAAGLGRIRHQRHPGPLRALLGGGRATLKQRPTASRLRYGRRPLARGALPRPSGPPDATGRWSLLPPSSRPTHRAAARADVLLDRYGVVTRGSVANEVTGGFASAYRVFAALEDSGQVRRGYFVEGLGAAQFGDRHAVDLLREATALPTALVLAATDRQPLRRRWRRPGRRETPARPQGRRPGRAGRRRPRALRRTRQTHPARLHRRLPGLAAAAKALADAVHAGVWAS